MQSMDLAAAVGAERLREIMAELVNRAAAVVQRYGGTVDKFTGDGIMAVFGAPVALEDHAVRACLAALGVQDEAKRLAEEVQRRDGVDLQLRVGLNSGQVIAGEIGSGALGYTAIGEQVGMAQRMESVAPAEDRSPAHPRRTCHVSSGAERTQPREVLMSEVKPYRDEILSLLRRADCHYGAALRDEEAGLSIEQAARKRQCVPVARISSCSWHGCWDSTNPKASSNTASTFGSLMFNGFVSRRTTREFE